MKKLLGKLRETHIRIIFIEENVEDSNLRDKLFAKHLMLCKTPVAFLCGNIHARKNFLRLPPSDPLFSHYNGGSIVTCGGLLPKTQTQSIKIEAVNGGRCYNFSIQKVKPNLELSPSYKKKDLPLEIPSLENSFDTYYLVDRFSASR